jgi:hypothetical protein
MLCYVGMYTHEDAKHIRTRCPIHNITQVWSQHRLQFLLAWPSHAARRAWFLERNLKTIPAWEGCN